MKPRSEMLVIAVLLLLAIVNGKWLWLVISDDVEALSGLPFWVPALDVVMTLGLAVGMLLERRSRARSAAPPP